ADTAWPDPPIGFLAAPLVLGALALGLGLAGPQLEMLIAAYADTAPGAADAHLVLWHGLQPALFVSLATLILGAAAFWLTRATDLDRTGRIMPFTASDMYFEVVRSVDRLSVVVTRLTQRGSLPLYVGTVFLVLIASQGTVLLAGHE